MKHILIPCFAYFSMNLMAQHSITFRVKGTQGENDYLKELVLFRKSYNKDMIGTTDATGCITINNLKTGDTVTLAHGEYIPFKYIVPAIIPTTPVEAKLVYGNLTVDEPAQFEGGKPAWVKFQVDNLKYPQRAAEEEIQGKVIIRFVVDIDGSISDLKVIKPISDCPECAEEAMRVIKLGKWTPGKAGGKPVKSYLSMPFTFRLN